MHSHSWEQSFVELYEREEGQKGIFQHFWDFGSLGFYLKLAQTVFEQILEVSKSHPLHTE
jgi:hypothetical protein